ncbi:metal-sensitive transcriptional regulator [Glutamicibacter arilaitensis]|uniref:metal-sensitive transcriptional regulator n=1 Tax=Glutamicibacter arilaitensis TaxID=256701 RepID=UPI003A8D3D83
MRTADEATRKRILNRLKRARGQLDAVINAVETDGSCKEVVTQLAAVSTALDRAGFAIVSTAMQYCIADPEKASAEEDGLSVEELEKLFLSLS